MLCKFFDVIPIGGSISTFRKLYCFTLEESAIYTLTVALLSAADTLALVEVVQQCSTAAAADSQYKLPLQVAQAQTKGICACEDAKPIMPQGLRATILAE